MIKSMDFNLDMFPDMQAKVSYYAMGLRKLEIELPGMNHDVWEITYEVKEQTTFISNPSRDHMTAMDKIVSLRNFLAKEILDGMSEQVEIERTHARNLELQIADLNAKLEQTFDSSNASRKSLASLCFKLNDAQREEIRNLRDTGGRVRATKRTREILNCSLVDGVHIVDSL